MGERRINTRRGRRAGQWTRRTLGGGRGRWDCTARACAYAAARARERAGARRPDRVGREAGKAKQPLVDGGRRGTRRAASGSGGVSARAGSHAGDSVRPGRCRAASPPGMPGRVGIRASPYENAREGGARDRRAAPGPPPCRAALRPRHARTLLLGPRGRELAVHRRRRRPPSFPADLPRRALPELADADGAGGAGGRAAALRAARRDPLTRGARAPDRQPRRLQPDVAIPPPPFDRSARECARRAAPFFSVIYCAPAGRGGPRRAVTGPPWPSAMDGRALRVVAAALPPRHVFLCS